MTKITTHVRGRNVIEGDRIVLSGAMVTVLSAHLTDNGHGRVLDTNAGRVIVGTDRDVLVERNVRDA